MKYNQHTDNNEPTMVSEPVATYGAAIASCQPTRHHSPMPGVYTDEEFEEEIRKSLASGTVSNEEALKRLPCQFSDEEWAEEIRLSEESGFVPHEDVMQTLEQWGLKR